MSIFQRVLNWLNRNDPAIPKPGPPRPGEKWEFLDGSPWSTSSKYPDVEILEVRDGWVRYDMGGMFRDERKSLKDFTWMYRKAR